MERTKNFSAIIEGVSTKENSSMGSLISADSSSEPSLEISLAPSIEDQVKEATWQTENLVFDRDEYAKKEFWDDRFKE